MTYWPLVNGDTQLVFVDRGGHLCLEYVGAALGTQDNLEAIAALTEAVVPHGELDRPIQRSAFPTETGIADAAPAFMARRGGHSIAVAPRLVDAITDSANRFRLIDEDARVEIELTLTPENGGVWRFETTVINRGVDTLDIDWLASAHLPLPAEITVVSQLGGYWANEFQERVTALGPVAMSWRNQRGRSSHDSSASLLVMTPQTGESSGTALQCSLQWPGDHELKVIPIPSGGHALQLGVAIHAGDISLRQDEHYTSPPALLAHSLDGRNGIRGKTRAYWSKVFRATDTPLLRPVHFNSWEACYFDHDERLMLALIPEARALGAERFVLDDGWMGGRTAPGVGLGDWDPCATRYPRGLACIADAVRAEGMTFGLWIEPEMVTADAQIAEQHPEWVIGKFRDNGVTGRGQFLLDLTDPDVQTHVSSVLDRLVNECHPDYLKWDMNRDYAELIGEQGPSSLALNRAFIALVHRFRERHPEVSLELCGAGGPGRHPDNGNCRSTMAD